jgi:hypothetical protein
MQIAQKYPEGDGVGPNARRLAYGKSATALTVQQLVLLKQQLLVSTRPRDRHRQVTGIFFAHSQHSPNDHKYARSRANQTGSGSSKSAEEVECSDGGEGVQSGAVDTVRPILW